MRGRYNYEVKFLRPACLLALLFLVLVSCFFRGEIVMMLDSRYSEKNLMGLTPLQVIRQLGPPDIDSGESLYEPPGGKTRRVQTLVYKYAGAARTIDFMDGKVFDVAWDRK